MHARCLSSGFLNVLVFLVQWLPSIRPLDATVVLRALMSSANRHPIATTDSVLVPWVSRVQSILGPADIAMTSLIALATRWWELYASALVRLMPWVDKPLREP